MNKPKINPNEDLMALSKYDGMLRRNGFKPAEMMAVKRMALEVQADAEWDLLQRIPLLIFGILVNVLHGNHYMSKKKIQAVVQECCDLYYECSLSLLDIEDVNNYNVKIADIYIEPKKLDKIKQADKPSFKVSEMVSHMERLSKIMTEQEEQLLKDIDIDPDENSESYANLRFLKALRKEFAKAGLMNDK